MGVIDTDFASAQRSARRSTYNRRKQIARIEGEIRLWTAIDPMLYADKIAELKAQL